MKNRLFIFLPAVVLAAAFLVLFRSDLNARDPRHLNRPAAPTTQCGYWGDMSEGMSCR
ncbi:hypothetical protein AB7714_12880 [Tardiphaga sp. 1201_B9_N1_1]|uniref:hypothetical protein n=1 Tax=unclassified Tardiphaga TaxID=2631404 RepID=UPI003F2858C8